MKEPFTVEFFHGEDESARSFFVNSTAPLEKQHAVDFIIDTVSQYSEKVTIAVTGPMTNITLAIINAPQILENIEQIVMMGGVRREDGNISPLRRIQRIRRSHATSKVLEYFKQELKHTYLRRYL